MKQKPKSTNSISGSKSALNIEGSPDVDNSAIDDRYIERIVAKEYRYAILGLIFGIIFAVCGLVLTVFSIAGKSSLTASLSELKIDVQDAAPGVIGIIVGFLIIYATRPSVNLGRIKRRRGKKNA